MAEAPRRVLLGEITGAHGVRGEVLVRSYTAEPADIATYGALTDDKGGAALMLKVVRTTPKGALVVRVHGVSDRNAAEALMGRKLFVARSAMPEPESDDFYHADLVGLSAVDSEGATVGTVVAVANYGAGDILEIRLLGGRQTELLPFTKAFVPVVDLAAGKVGVVLPVSLNEDDDGAADSE
ncbi:MAG: ribosome maturation factor RimM [Hyphomicrobiaceae bacterium]